ncbi:MAG: twin-arginine translocation signal domain-containing protein [Gammaproteobacteria bacterium]
MSNSDSGISRRSFIATSTVAAAAGALAATAPPEAAAKGANASLGEASALQGASVSLIVNAMHDLKMDAEKQVMSLAIRPLVLPGKRTVIGRAVTTKWVAGTERMTAETARKYVFDPIDQGKPGSMWVVAGGTDGIYSLWGDIVGAACKRNGFVGAVTDSGCRDIAGMAEIGFPVFAKSAVPYGPGGFIHPVAANEPVVCGGVMVRPGDLVAADGDGVIVIPIERAVEVAKATAAHGSREADMRRKLRAGASLADTYKIS